MNIAVLSGKGGAGKTFVSTNLAYTIKDSTYLDCDVEEPNGHLFFNPITTNEITITTKMPVFDEDKCTGCRKCIDFCKFNALAYIINKPVVFPEVCHSCGACSIICEYDAVSENDKEIGKVTVGKSGTHKVVTGALNIGEATGIPIIEEVISQQSGTTIIDCPPGSGCSVMESVKAADYCILVAEPTLFGLHNVKMVHELVTIFEKPVGIVINKSDSYSQLIKDYCNENNIDLLGEIGFSKNLARLSGSNIIASSVDKNIFSEFDRILDNVRRCTK